MAELAIVTSDNPRTEDVMDIIEDIKVGLAKTEGEYIVIPDRQEAVNYAVDHARNGDMIILRERTRGISGNQWREAPLQRTRGSRERARTLMKGYQILVKRGCNFIFFCYT